MDLTAAVIAGAAVYGGGVDMLHLRYFVAVAEERSFTRAADRLHMAASPLSRRIKDLERELGTELFVRTHHRIDLTAAGEALLPEAADLVARFDSVRDLTRRAAGRPTRTAVVGIAPDVSATLRDRFLGAVGERYPDIRTTLVPASTEPLLRELRAGNVDIALVHGKPAGPAVGSVLLERQAVGVVVGRSTFPADRTSVQLGELAALPFASISPDAAPGLYGRLDALLERNGIHKRITLSGHNFAGLAQLVATGQAFTLVSLGSGVTNRVFHGEPVTILDIDGIDVNITTVAAWRTSSPTSTIADLAEVARDLAKPRP